MPSKHYVREQPILNDLEASFPNFTGKNLAWIHNSEDPPDFIARGSTGTFGLEFREWLDGAQMGSASRRDSQRNHLFAVIGKDWQNEYYPKNISIASIEPHWGKRITAADEVPLRRQFYQCAAQVDRTWVTNLERTRNGYYQMEFPEHALMETYIRAIRYTGTSPHGACWIQTEQDGGAYDPTVSFRTLEESLQEKLAKFASPNAQAKILRHNILETYLLIHGGWNEFKNNKPHHPLKLEQIARRGAEFYAAHPKRALFKEVWFFESLDSADEWNAVLGLPAGYGRVRWLAKLWPTFRVHEGSSEAVPLSS